MVSCCPLQRLHPDAAAQIEAFLHFPCAPAFLGQPQSVPRLRTVGATLGSLAKTRECLAEIGIGPQLPESQRYQPGPKRRGEVGLVRLAIALGGTKERPQCSGVARACQ